MLCKFLSSKHSKLFLQEIVSLIFIVINSCIQCSLLDYSIFILLARLLNFILFIMKKFTIEIINRLPYKQKNKQLI